MPVVADLAVMRDAIKKLGGNPDKVSPLQPVDLVIDHSVQVDSFGTANAFAANAQLEFERNQERYLFLRWGQGAFDNFRVVPPDTGIVHQVNLEYLAPVVFSSESGEAYPDTVIGTDSHTTMINGLGVVGWGVGGIEAEAAMLGRSMPMLIPEVIGFRLAGSLRPGATATDLVLTVTQMLRKKGVVGKFVEYFGPGLASLPVADRATLGNMSPEYGATMGYFPVDEQTLTYLRLTGRSDSQIRLIEAYCKAQGLFNSPDAPEPKFSDTLELDLGSVVPSMAGPRRPQDRVALTAAKSDFRRELGKEFEEHPSVDRDELAKWVAEGGNGAAAGEGTILESKLGHIAHKVEVHSEAGKFPLTHGSIVIAAITSCTNTSNPSVMLAAGILAKKAVARGLTVKPFVKTSLAPGSKVVTQYLKRAGLIESLEKLRFNLVGYGCTTCIGNSGPVDEAIAGAIKNGNLVACAILSGNRNFEGRINPVVRFNYLASPPLVVAYAIAGTMDIDVEHQPLGTGSDGRPGFSARHLAVAGRGRGGSYRLGSRRDVQERVWAGVRRRRAMEESEGPRGQPVPMGAGFAVRKSAAVLRRRDREGWRVHRHQRRAGAGRSRRQRDDGSYFAGGFDRARQSSRQVPDRARRAAQGFQLVRRAARES